jgi:capsid protein
MNIEKGNASKLDSGRDFLGRKHSLVFSYYYSVHYKYTLKSALLTRVLRMPDSASKTIQLQVSYW